MNDKADSSLARMLGVLDLFTDQRLLWSADEIAEALQVSRPTGYRYVKLLTQAGLLQRAGDAQVTLGPRIIELDHFIRQADPVLQHGIPFIKELVALTGFDCVVSSLLGTRLLDTHREYSAAPADLNYGRGRPRPLLLGAAPKVILAQLPSGTLHKILDAHTHYIEAAGLPAHWPEFRRYFARIRKAGFYFSLGELEPALGALAVPLLARDGRVIGALSLVSSVARLSVTDTSKLTPLLQRAATDICSRL